MNPAPLVRTLAALADETRWGILTSLGAEDLSASALAQRMPVSRQAIAKHLSTLVAVGLVETLPAGREVRYRALGTRLEQVAADLDAIGAGWDRRLQHIKRVAERG
ncbi:metalloregulator ArsR/SmtB family transcription factor [soil metagenome]